MLWDRTTQRLAVLDLEHCTRGPVLRDIVLLLGNVRARLFNPLISNRDVGRDETAFWEGYGPLDRELRFAADLFASAWLFYRFLPGLSDRWRMRGGGQAALIAVYRSLAQPFLVRKTLRKVERGICGGALSSSAPGHPSMTPEPQPDTS
jgi:hypothetical protein